jgi:RHS repeat-associated protein
VLEEQQSGNDVNRYVWSPVYVNAMVLRDRATTTPGTLNERTWDQQDANWNTTALVDGSGAVQERYSYDPYGVATVYDSSYTVRGGGTSYASVYLFQGMRFDSISGLDSADMRWYSPPLARWITVDPLGYEAGDADLYNLLGQNPITDVDPTGLDDGIEISGFVDLATVLKSPETKDFLNKGKDFKWVDQRSTNKNVLIQGDTGKNGSGQTLYLARFLFGVQFKFTAKGKNSLIQYVVVKEQTFDAANKVIKEGDAWWIEGIPIDANNQAIDERGNNLNIVKDCTSDHTQVQIKFTSYVGTYEGLTVNKKTKIKDKPQQKDLDLIKPAEGSKSISSTVTFTLNVKGGWTLKSDNPKIDESGTII